MAKKILGLFAVFCVLSFSVAQAAEFIAPSQDEGNVTVGVAETHRNLYVAGANVTVNGSTLGDLFAAGGTVTVDGSVEQDLVAAGGTLISNSAVGGDARIAGGNVTVNGTIGGDLLAAGGNLTFSERSSVAGDAVIAGGNVTVNTPIRGNARVAGGNITINSRIEGTLTVNSSQRLVFGPRAEVPGRIVYKGPSEASVDPAARISPIEFTRVEMDQRAENTLRALFTIAFLTKLLAWMIAGWVLLRLWRAAFSRMEDSIRANPWGNLGMGLVTLIVVPIAAILLFLVLVGYYVALVGLAAYVLMILLASVIAALVLGSLIVRWLTKKTPGNVPDWQIIVIGVVVWHLVGLVPFVGAIAKFILFLMAFGALARMVRESLMKKNA